MRRALAKDDNILSERDSQETTPYRTATLPNTSPIAAPLQVNWLNWKAVASITKVALGSIANLAAVAKTMTDQTVVRAGETIDPDNVAEVDYAFTVALTRIF